MQQFLSFSLDHKFLKLSAQTTLVSLAALLLANQANAAERVLYVGTMEGAGKIVMELETDNNEIARGRYFYDRIGIDIPLQGKPDNLQEAISRKDLSGEENEAAASNSVIFDNSTTSFQGTLDNGWYRGKWIDGTNNIEHNFTLQEIARYQGTDTPPNADKWFSYLTDAATNPSPDLYTDLKYQDHNKPEGPIFGDDNFAFQYRIDNRTNARYPYVVRYNNNPEKVAQLNRVLKQRHDAVIRGALECKGAVYYIGAQNAGTDGGYVDNMTSQITWASDRFLAIRESGSVYCWGAHPNNFVTSVTYDLKNGVREASWNDYLDLSTFDEDGNRLPNPKLVEHIRAQPDVKAKIDESENAKFPCYQKALLNETLTFFLDKKDALSFGSDSAPSFISMCNGPQGSIGFSELKNFWRPGAQALFEKPAFVADKARPESTPKQTKPKK